MDVKQILSFIKIEHTLFSLPFVLIGYFIAIEQFNIPLGIELLWILLAAIGARGLAMALNRIIDREIDAANPRTEGRHLASGAMSLQTAWSLAAGFLVLLLLSAGLLNQVALMMAWLPVLTFVVYPYMKRYTWLCHFWLGLCLGLAPAGAWVAIAADVHGWTAITGMFTSQTEFLWAPTILPISLGVLLWIAAFDINYARMDIENDKRMEFIPFPQHSMIMQRQERRFNSRCCGLLALLSQTPWTEFVSCSVGRNGYGEYLGGAVSRKIR